MAPLLSILLPTYNCRDFIGAQIDSISGQTLPDFELIVIDDGSTDGTLDVVYERANRDSRMRIVPSRGNVGQRERILQLLTLARSGLIAFADQDDVWDEAKLQNLVAGLGSSLLAFGRSELIDEHGRSLGINTFQAMDVVPGSDFKLRALCSPLTSAHCMIVVKEAISLEAFSRLDPFDWLIFLEAVFSGTVIHIDSAVVHHRIHSRNQSNATLGRSRRSGLRLMLPRCVMPAGYMDRLAFFKKVEHLGHSRMVRDHDREVFLSLARATMAQWLIESPLRTKQSNRAFHTLLLNSLEPLAGSPADSLGFRNNARRLTSAFIERGQRR